MTSFYRVRSCLFRVLTLVVGWGVGAHGARAQAPTLLPTVAAGQTIVGGPEDPPLACIDTTGLRLWLPLRQLQGTLGSTQARNYARHGQPGTVSGGLWEATSEARPARSLFLAGRDQVVVPFTTPRQPTAFSVAFWVRPVRRTNWNCFLGARLAGGYPGHPWGGFGFLTTATGQVAVGIDHQSANGYLTSAPGVMSAGWQHFVFTYDTNRTGTLYRNGVQVGAPLLNMPVPQPWHAFVVGNQPHDPNLPFDGSLADLRVYERALDLTDVQALAGCGASSGLACSVGRLQMSSAVTIAPGQSTWLEARPLQAALAFDGVADQVVVRRPGASTPALLSSVENTFTVEAWVQPTASHEVDAPRASGIEGVWGQRYLLFPEHGGQWGDHHAGMGLSVGTNGVSVYEHAAYYVAPLLVWQGNLANKWTHVAVVYRHGRPTLFVDGDSVQGLPSAQRYVHPSVVFGGGSYGYYQGEADELRIWNVARSASELQAQRGHTVLPQPGLVGCWHLDEGQGLSVADASGQGLTGTRERGAGAGGTGRDGPQWQVQVPSTAPVTPPALTYEWLNRPGLAGRYSARVQASPLITTTYSVFARTAPGCLTTHGQVTVTVAPLPAQARNKPVNPVGGVCPIVFGGPAPLARTGATDSVNFVRTWVPRVALLDTAVVRQGSKEQVQVTTEYLDGLGRPVQTVQRQESPGGHDIVQPVAYDALGRQPRQYLPYVAGTTGAYRPDALREQYNFYRQNPAPMGPGNLSQDVTPTGVAYAETAFEASPLNRVLAQGSPGEAWQLTGGHAVGTTERGNTATDVAIPRFVAGYAPTPRTLTTPGNYAVGELWLRETRDEDSARTQTFTDKEGQVVARRVAHTAPGAATPGWLSTYYVYDDFNRRRAVVPPKAAALLAAGTSLGTPAIDSLLFRYQYDGRGRPIAQQVPGQVGDTYVVYDARDQPILTQDSSQRARTEWAFIKYDALGRPVLTGLVRRPATRATLQAEADAAANSATPWETRTAASAAAPLGYTTDGAYPRLGQLGFTAWQVLTISDYDDYNFDRDPAGLADVAYSTASNSQFDADSLPVADLRVMGLPTRTRVRVLGVAEGQPGAWLTTTTFYDAQARPIQVQATNARGGADRVTSQLSFTGQVRKRVTVHHGPNLPAVGVQVIETARYDHAGRLLNTRQQVSGEPQPALLAAHAYNELGQLTRKTLGSGALTQPIDYRYNPRGWLTQLNDADNPTPGRLFHLTLSYAECGFERPRYNGNLAGQKWRGRDGIERAYAYAYDGASRLVAGDYVARAGGPGATTGAWTAEEHRFSLQQLTYDANGNILTLERRGLLALGSRTAPATFGLVDGLTYAYAGNRLRAVTDRVTTNALPRPAGYVGAPTSLAGDFQEQGLRQAQEYAYDVSGNLTADQQKGLTAIAYNHLHLPRRITFGPSTGADSLVFRYSATGQKVAKFLYQRRQPLPVRTDYLGGFHYEQDSLRFFPHAEGRVLRSVSPLSGAVTYEREFTLKDHLGNLRLAYRAGHRLTYTAGMEPGDAPRETHQFDSLSVSPPIAWRTPTLARGGEYVARLHAGGPTPRPLGPLKQLRVQKGDTVLVTAPGYYPPVPHTPNFPFSLASFVASLLPQQPTGPPRDGRVRALPLLSIGLSAAGLAPLVQHSGVPKGYVRLLVFDADSNYVTSRTAQFAPTTPPGGYYELRVEVIVPQDGYVTAYVGNESDADVYFDDVTIEHRQGLRVQETHYDPVGLELAGLAPHSPGLKPLNQYKFNGQEFQADLGLNWNHHDWRFFDPQLGRWHTVDPLADAGQEMWSPYSFGFNNALRFSDPDGRCPTCKEEPVGSVAGMLYSTAAGLVVSAINAVMFLGDGNPALSGGIQHRATLAANGDISFGMRLPASSVREVAGNLASDVLDIANVGATAVSGGAGRGLAMGGGLLLAKTGGANVVTNAIAQEGKALLKGSGPVAGVLEVSDRVKSVKAFNNYSPAQGGIEFVFDHSNNRFAAGKGKGRGSPHQKLGEAINADHDNLVGGMMQRTSTGINTTENSGHYGEKWTPAIRDQFKTYMENKTGKSVNHELWK